VSAPRTERLLFFGTPDFAVPSLCALAASRHTVVGAVSQPDRPKGRGRKLEATPVKHAAEQRGIPVLQPEKVGAPEAIAWMGERAPTLGIVVAFGQFIPRAVRELPPEGMINAHGSLLPRHRGAAPIAYTILCGDPLAGISIIQVAREMDAGPECFRLETPVGADETAGELTERLAILAGEALCQAVEQIATGTAVFREQDHARATLAPKLDRSFAALDWREPRAGLLRRIRAATPWPGCALLLGGDARRVKLLQVRDGGDFAGDAPHPGAIDVAADCLRIAALDGWIEVLRLQPAGRRPMDAQEYLRGANIQPGEEARTP